MYSIQDSRRNEESREEDHGPIPVGDHKGSLQHKSDFASAHVPAFDHSWTLSDGHHAPWSLSSNVPYYSSVADATTSAEFPPQIWQSTPATSAMMSDLRRTSMASVEPFSVETVSPLSDRDLAPPTDSSGILQRYNYSPGSEYLGNTTSAAYRVGRSYTNHDTYFDINAASNSLPWPQQYPPTTYADIRDTYYPVASIATMSGIDIPQAAAEFHAIQDELAQPSTQGHAYPNLHHSHSSISPMVPSGLVSVKTEDLSTWGELEDRIEAQDHVKREPIAHAKPKPKKIIKKPQSSMTLIRKTKAEPLSRQTSCWRCRRYKKPCNGSGSVCDACVTSGFRIWSTDIGCRKGDMSEFIMMLIPTDVDKKSVTIKDSYLKPQSFRRNAQLYQSGTIIPHSAMQGDIWDQFLYKIQSTGIHGPGVLELVQVAVRHQRKLEKPDKVLIWAAHAMSTAADIFRLLVATKADDMFVSGPDLTTIFSQARKVLSAAAGQFLRNCLTGRIKQWFTTLLASNINVFAYVLVGDAIAAMPAKYRNEIWPDVRKTLMDMRQVLYPTARDLLNALSKGSQPLNMSCWDTERVTLSPGRPSRLIRNAEGMRLVDQCEATFDGMRELQMWREEFSYLLHGDRWMSTQPLAVDLLLISSVSRMYILPTT